MPADPHPSELFRRGSRLLEDGDAHAAAIPLARARQLEPQAEAVREALGRALFACRRFTEAAAEFEAAAAMAPTNDYALFCWGRALQQLGRHAEALTPLARAAGMRPERSDYRLYRDRARAAAQRDAA